MLLYSYYINILNSFIFHFHKQVIEFALILMVSGNIFVLYLLSQTFICTQAIFQSLILSVEESLWCGSF